MKHEEVDNEPFKKIAADDPVTCAIYGRDHDLLSLPGWIRFKALATRQKKLLRLQNQAKLSSYRMTPRYKFGYEVPRNKDFDHAISIYKKNGNNKLGGVLYFEIQKGRGGLRAAFAARRLREGDRQKTDDNPPAQNK